MKKDNFSSNSTNWNCETKKISIRLLIISILFHASHLIRYRACANLIFIFLFRYMIIVFVQLTFRQIVQPDLPRHRSCRLVCHVWWLPDAFSSLTSQRDWRKIRDCCCADRHRFPKICDEPCDPLPSWKSNSTIKHTIRKSTDVPIFFCLSIIYQLNSFNFFTSPAVR